MTSIANYLFLLSVCCASTIYGQTVIQGPLEANTLWNRQGSPYVVAQDLFVPMGVTLTITSGTKVLFRYDTSGNTGYWKRVELIVEGTLVVDGSIGDSVEFDAEQHVPGDDIPWGGIVIARGDSSSIRFATIQNAGIGIYVSDQVHHLKVNDSRVAQSTFGIQIASRTDLAIKPASFVLTNCRVENNSMCGVVLGDGHFVTSTSNFYFDQYFGSYIFKIDGCDVINNWVGVLLGVNARAGSFIRNSRITQNTTGIVLNSTRAEISYCDITSNLVGLAGSWNTSSAFVGSVRQCNISNATWNVYWPTNSNYAYDFTNNWWGTISRDSVQQKIYDKTDSFVGAYVSIDPILTERVSWAPTGAEFSPSSHPRSIEMLAAFPNPFNPSTTITINSSFEGSTDLEIFDLHGREVFSEEIHLSSGSTSVLWSASNYPSGIYIVRVTGRARDGRPYTHSQKLVLTK